MLCRFPFDQRCHGAPWSVEKLALSSTRKNWSRVESERSMSADNFVRGREKRRNWKRSTCFGNCREAHKIFPRDVLETSNSCVTLGRSLANIGLPDCEIYNAYQTRNPISRGCRSSSLDRGVCSTGAWYTWRKPIKELQRLWRKPFRKGSKEAKWGRMYGLILYENHALRPCTRR